MYCCEWCHAASSSIWILSIFWFKKHEDANFRLRYYFPSLTLLTSSLSCLTLVSVIRSLCWDTLSFVCLPAWTQPRISARKNWRRAWGADSLSSSSMSSTANQTWGTAVGQQSCSCCSHFTQDSIVWALHSLYIFFAWTSSHLRGCPQMQCSHYSRPDVKHVHGAHLVHLKINIKYLSI